MIRSKILFKSRRIINVDNNLVIQHRVIINAATYFKVAGSLLDA